MRKGEGEGERTRGGAGRGGRGGGREGGREVECGLGLLFLGAMAISFNPRLLAVMYNRCS